MKLMWKAIQTSLVADAPLVALCEYTASPFKPTITRASFQSAGYKRGIYYMENPGYPYLYNTNSIELKEWVVEFNIIGPTLEVMSDIASAFEAMFDQTPNLFSYWDFSNDDIHVRSSSIIDVEGGKHDDKVNVWCCKYSVKVCWSYC